MRFSVTTLGCLVMFTLGGVAWAGTKEDEAEIKDVFASFSKSWNQPGMLGFEDLFAEDADFVVITGKWLKGRSEIVSYHRKLLEGRYKGSHSSMDSEDVRFASPDIAIAHVASRGQYTQDGQQLTRTGLATATLAKRHGKWLITAFHNTLTSGPGALSSSPAAPEVRNEPTSAEVQSIVEQIKKMEHARIQAGVRKDVAAVDRATADEYVQIDWEGRVLDKAAALDRIQSNNIRLQSNTLDELDVKVYGDTAIVTGLATRKGAMDGKDISAAVRYTRTYIKRDGRWQVVQFQQTRVAESSDGETEKELIMLQNEWAAARIKGDIAFLERLYAKEFRITNMNGSVVERDADIAVFAARPRVLQPTYIVDEDMKVSTYGELAVVTGIENLKGTLKGVYGEMALRFTNVFVRRDGRWQLVTHHSTEVRKK